LFCRVVDNYGDAAVCWRLARQLTSEHAWQVCLWIDDLQPLSRLEPAIAEGRGSQMVAGVRVRQWPAATLDRDWPAADVVVEAFACELPEAYAAAMAGRARPPVWLNLEYLSAESWIDGCHGLASPHSRLPLTKHFFFPGFTPASGGLLRERGFQAPPPPATVSPLRVSLFCYDNAALPRLLDRWAEANEDLHLLVADGMPRRQVGAWLGCRLAPGDRHQRGRLHIETLPFLDQQGYDALLASCHLNFVRGEDSFVRAQWAERPLVWQAYPQADAAHLVKLDAFLDRYLMTLGPEDGRVVGDFLRAWNGRGDPWQAWPAFRAALPALQRLAPEWAGTLAKQGDLAAKLVHFCMDRI
jgi:hypothetical protein